MKVGIIGLGFGAAIQLPVFQSLPDVQVVAIAAASLEKSRTVAQLKKIPHAFSGINDLLNVPLDCVSLCLPPYLVAEACTKALNRGIDVLCEKPLGTTLKESQGLLELAKGRTTGIDFQFAELVAFQKFHRAIREMGKTSNIEVIWKVQSYAHKNRLWSWKTNALAGGGVMSLLGSHTLFLLEWLFGKVVKITEKIDSNQATKEFAPAGGIAAEDYVSMKGILENNTHFSMTITNSYIGDPEHRWQAWGEDQYLTLENHEKDFMAGFTLRHVQKDITSVLHADSSEQIGSGREQAFSSLAKRFINAVRDRQSFYPDFSTGTRVHELTEMGQTRQPYCQ